MDMETWWALWYKEQYSIKIKVAESVADITALPRKPPGVTVRSSAAYLWGILAGYDEPHPGCYAFTLTPCEDRSKILAILCFSSYTRLL